MSFTSTHEEFKKVYFLWFLVPYLVTKFISFYFGLPYPFQMHVLLSTSLSPLSKTISKSLPLLHVPILNIFLSIWHLSPFILSIFHIYSLFPLKFNFNFVFLLFPSSSSCSLLPCLHTAPLAIFSLLVFSYCINTPS